MGPKNLTVNSEQLTFDCEKEDCAVVAVYQIDSPSEQTAAFSFVAPSRVDISVKVADETISPAFGSPETSITQDSAPSYETNFQATLPKGKFEIEIRYRQTLGQMEDHVSYRSAGKIAKSFAYALWPLKEWQLASDFSLNVNFSAPNSGFFRRLFGSPRELSCLGTPRETGPTAPSKLLEGKLETRNSQRKWSIRFEKEFPDQLRCWIHP